MSNPANALCSLLSVLLLIVSPPAAKGAANPYQKLSSTEVYAADSASTAGQSSVGDDPFKPVNPDGSTSIEPWININDALDTEYKRYPLPPDASSSRDFPVCGVPVNVDTTPLGAATFSIPIEVPPGVASMTPQLSIAYSSMQGDGPLGLGCFIQGLSGITRTSKDIWHDDKVAGVAYDESDALRLDRKRLMKKSGATAGGDKVFTIEDSPFTTVIQHGTGTESWFEVKMPDGMTMKYGATENSRQTVATPSGKTFITSWQISSSEDTNGNFIEYRYLHDGLCLYPYIISYGGNRHTTSGAKNEIVFGYGDRSDASSLVIGGAAGRMSKILSSIVTKTGGAVYRKTRLRYSQDQGSGRSLLKGVRIGVTDQKRQKEIVVAWNETQTFHPSAKEIYADTSLPLTEKKGQKLLTADFNGDGVTDIVEFAEAEINLGGGTKKLTNLCIPYHSSVKADGTVAHSMSQPIELGKDFSSSNWKQKSGYPMLADMNGDGTSDLVIPCYDRVNGKDYALIKVYWGSDAGLSNGNASATAVSLVTSKDLPMYGAADFNGDGRSEILVVEPQNDVLGMNPCHFVGYTENGKEQTLRTFNIVFNFGLKQFFTADFDGDGTADFMLMHEDGCLTYLNKGGNFAEYGLAQPVADLSVKDADIVDMGDFNGDGIPDFVMFSGGKLTVATGDGDGHFTPHEAQTVEGISKSGFDSNLAQTAVYDFDSDGKSDIVLIKADKSKAHAFWLRSEGTSFHLVRDASSPDRKEASAGLYAVGDLDGDGFQELLNMGFDAWQGTSASGARPLRAYPSAAGPSSLKVSSIRNSFLSKASFEYKSLATGGIYAKGTDASYPVADTAVPLGVVSTVTKDNGAAGSNTWRFRYGGLKTHVQGKGLLGMTQYEATNEAIGKTQKTEVLERDVASLLPMRTLTEETAGDGKATAITTYKITGKGDRCFFAYPSETVNTDADGNVTVVRTDYDTGNGCMTASRTEYDDGSYDETRYSGYVQKQGRWLPGKVEKRKKHTDDSSVYSDKTLFEYDSNGNIYRQTVHAGTPKELTTKYVERDWYGNPLSVYVEGDGTSDLLMVSEHDKTGRFVTRKYTDPETTRFSYAYDTFGRLLKETDETDPANPLSIVHGYNSWGQETRTTSPEGACLKTWYGWSSDAAHNHYKLTYCFGQPWTKTWYDACGRETRTEAVGEGGLLQTTDTEYDSRGNAVRTTMTRGRLTESIVRIYDSRGRLTAETARSGKKTEYVYGRRSVSVSDGVKTVTREYDAQGNIHKAADPMTTVEYRYSSNGKPKEVACAGGTLRMEYDEAGNRTMLDDPDAGTKRSTFDAEGKLTSRTDGRGNTRTYCYDEFGRLERATGADGDITYTYDSQGRISMTEHDDSAIGYAYDKYGRTITECRSFADGDMQVRTYEYDKFGNVVKETWPGGVSVSYAYDAYGNNTACVMGTDTVWAAKSDDGLASEESILGGAFTKVRRLDSFGFLSELRLEQGKRKKFRRMRYVYDPKTGCMTYRDGMRSSGSDSFKYDSMDRLVSYTKNLFELADSTSGAVWQISFPGSIAGGIAPGIGEGAAQSRNTDSYAYSPDGNITSFPVAGRYSYMSDRPHAVAEVSNPDGKMNAAEQHISYNAISKASAILESRADGEYGLDMRYGPDGERWTSVMTKDGEDILTVHYGNGYESQERGDTLREYTYLGNGLLHYSENGSGRLLYMFTDGQGSVTDIYGEDGDCVFNAEYNPWGNMTAQKNEIAFRRGYTGHEMLPEFGLVNMNGRMYDPRIGRFLSPDPYVQMPDNGQNFNRYSYCLNNPLKYTDPSGKLFGLGGFFYVMALYNVASSMIRAEAFGQNVWKAGAVSLFSTAATSGIGATFGSTGGIYSELMRAGAHGIAGGIETSMSGGSFGSGFFVGAVSSGMGSLAQGLKLGSGYMLGMSTIGGGLSSIITGGSFVEGALQGLNIGIFNHLTHDVDFSHDESGNIVGSISEVIITGKRPVVWHFLENASTLYGMAQTLYEDVRIGSNKKLYYRNGKYIFNGNQHVSVNKVKGLGLIKIGDHLLNAAVESREAIYAYNVYGSDSREYRRALFVASGRIAGSEIGAQFLGEGLAYGASAAAGTYSEGLLSGPAFVLGRLVGGYAGGILGGDFGGAISGAVFDYFYY